MNLIYCFIKVDFTVFRQMKNCHLKLAAITRSLYLVTRLTSTDLNTPNYGKYT